MARQRDLGILAHGVRYWNEHARRLGVGRADFTGASLGRARLDDIDLRGADLSGADLRLAKLRRADLRDAIFDGADLSDANLNGAIAASASLKHAKLHRTRAISATFERTEFADSDLSDADFSAAKLSEAIFRRSDLTRTKLVSADLTNAVFYHGIMIETQLSGARLHGAYFGGMSINDVNLSDAQGLDQTHHRAASFVSFDTVRRNLTAEVVKFLKACGLNDVEIAFAGVWRSDLSPNDLTDIAYAVARLVQTRPIMLNPLFISYAHADRKFVDRVELAFQEHGIQCWRDVKDMTVGPLDTQIDRAIRLNPTVLLVLSAASVRSDWVAWEAATARRIEREAGRHVLCPVTLDDAWKNCDWPGPLRQQIESYHLLDFRTGSTKRAFALSSRASVKVSGSITTIHNAECVAELWCEADAARLQPGSQAAYVIAGVTAGALRHSVFERYWRQPPRRSGFGARDRPHRLYQGRLAYVGRDLCSSGHSYAVRRLPHGGCVPGGSKLCVSADG